MQELIFYAVVHKDLTSCFGTHFSSLPGCFSAGDTLEDALAQAGEALEEYLSWLLEDDDPVLPLLTKEEILEIVEREGLVGIFPIILSGEKNISLYRKKVIDKGSPSR